MRAATTGRKDRDAELKRGENLIAKVVYTVERPARKVAFGSTRVRRLCKIPRLVIALHGRGLLCEG